MRGEIDIILSIIINLEERKTKMSYLEDLLAFQLNSIGIPFEREYKFCPSRKWRADFYIKPRLLIEIEGGTWIKGRHIRPAGFGGDIEKYNEAQILNFDILRFTAEQVKSGYAVNTIERLLKIYNNS